MKPLKPKSCRVCKSEFSPHNSLQVVCGIICGIDHTRAKQAKAAVRRDRALQAANRKDIAERREKLRTRSDHLSLAQQQFNKWVRLRDRGLPCISCGTTDPNIQYAAGHYRTTGSCPELRFTPDNCHSQCNKNCNLHKSGNIVEYRINLLKRIGQERLDVVEGPHEPLRLTIPEIKELTQKYRKLAKQLEAEHASLDI